MSRSPLQTLRKSFESSIQPIWLLDRHRKLLYVNAAVGAWLGIDAEQLIGRRCDYSWSAESNSDDGKIAALAPPPDVYGTVIAPHMAMTVASRDLTARRRVSFVPICDEHQQLEAVLGIAALEIPASVEASDSQPRSEAEDLHVRLGELRQKMAGLYELSQLIGEHSAIERVREQVRVAVQTRCRVVVQGPPGSGREHVARTIYYMQSSPEAAALVPLNCALLDNELLQLTLADYIKLRPEIEVEGPVSFLLLDVDELSPEAQTSLMAVLNIVELNVHSFATTRQSLLKLAEIGSFRPDLAHHLTTMVIELPPLNARREDIPLLAQKILEDQNSKGEKQWSGFTREALDELATYEWPHNIDQLTAVVREAAERATGPQIALTDLPDQLRFAAEAVAHPRRPPETIVLGEYLARIEAELIQRALKRAKGNRARAARLLGISRARLLRRISQLKVEI